MSFQGWNPREGIINPRMVQLIPIKESWYSWLVVAPCETTRVTGAAAVYMPGVCTPGQFLLTSHAVWIRTSMLRSV